MSNRICKQRKSSSIFKEAFLSVKIGDYLGTIAEPLRTIVHHFLLKLPPFAMLATFATFAVASRNFYPRRVYGLRTRLPPRPTRQPTRSFLVASMFQQHLSYIRPQRLYKPALRPPLLDRADSIRHSYMHIVSRSQGLPKTLTLSRVIVRSKEIPIYENCFKRGLRSCTVSPLDSARCMECVRSNRSEYNILGPIATQLETLSSTYVCLEEELEDAFER